MVFFVNTYEVAAYQETIINLIPVLYGALE